MAQKDAGAADTAESGLVVGLREAMSYAIPGGSGMRRKKIVVGVRCHLAEEFTKADSVGGSNPKWERHDGRELHVLRHRSDGGIAALGVYQLHRNGETRTWVGGNHFKFTRAVREPNTEIEQDLPLYVSGTPEGGAGSGIISIRFKWVPDAQTCNIEDVEEDASFRGELVVTILRASGLVMPHRIVRDVTTFVDTVPVYISFTMLALYLLAGFVFYFKFMNQSIGQQADFERFPNLLDRVQGGNGDWDSLNTVLFMVTSFTTVGYGNHPSLVATRPPCEVPGSNLLQDDPFSVLLPPQLRGVAGESMSRIAGLGLASLSGPVEQSFPPMPAFCFETADPTNQPEACMVIADDTHIFDFNTLLLWQKESLELPRNYSGPDRVLELQSLRVPGDTGIYDCSAARDADGEILTVNETQRACFARFAARCEEQLTLWRLFEQQKDVAKVFTSIFIMVGIGILGALVGAVGETLMEWVHSILGGVEYGRILALLSCICSVAFSRPALLWGFPNQSREQPHVV